MQLGLDIAPDVGVNRRSRSVAQPGSASGLGPEGREFESLHSDHFPLKNSGNYRLALLRVFPLFFAPVMIGEMTSIMIRCWAEKILRL